MVFPDSVRVHQIVDYWFCCERSRLMACLGLEAPDSEDMDFGCQVHSWLLNRPKLKKEVELLKALEPFMPFTRTFEATQIVGHPDDLTVLGRNKVQIVEYKTVDKPHVKPWKSVLAEKQVQLYAWLLEPIVSGLGYSLAHIHKVVYLSRNGMFLKKVSVEHDPFCVERQVSGVFGFWKAGEPLVKPLRWKCIQCPSSFKAQCRVWQTGEGEKKL